jgi:hypothetical protein
MIHLGGKYLTVLFGVTIKLIMLIEMCLKETWHEVHIGNLFSDWKMCQQEG